MIPNASALRRITVRDAQGRTITNFRLEDDNATLSFEGLPAGIYMIELVDLRNATAIRRVVKK
jgi:hypothetical protein